MTVTESLNLVEGEVEAISKEGQIGAGAGHCWVKLKNGETYLANVLQTVSLKEGQHIKFTYQAGGGAGLAAQITQILPTEEATFSGYEGVVNRCRELITQAKRTALDFIKSRWALGKELLDVPRKYGEGTITKLAADLGVKEKLLYDCMKFAERYPQFEVRELEKLGDSLAWRSMRRQFSSADENSTGNLPSNPTATPDELVEAYDPKRKPLPRSETKPELQMRSILEELGIKHVSQEPITAETKRGPTVYMADFVIKHNLILEVDSPLHKPDRDQERDEALRKAGYHTIRFESKQIESAFNLINRLKRAVASAEAVKEAR